MSTRSIVGRVNGDGFEGRYVHSDGYPSYQGAVLWARVRAHGDDAEGLAAEVDAFVDAHDSYSLLEASGAGPLGGECHCHDRGEGRRYRGPLTERSPLGDSGAEYAWAVDPEDAQLALFVPGGDGWTLRFVWAVDDLPPDWTAVERALRR